MLPILRSSLALALAALLLAASPAVPAAAGDDPTAGLVERLDGLAGDLDVVTSAVGRVTGATWDRAVARAIWIAGIDRLERSLAQAGVAADEALEPAIGPDAGNAVAAAITAALWSEAPAGDRRTVHRDVLAAWRRYQRAFDRAVELRDHLRLKAGLPLMQGPRTCPFEESIDLEPDWGDPRGWRTHKGNDINAPEGTRLVAMETGEVIQMGYHYLGGNGLFVQGIVTGDVYYYAHLSAYADGIEVGTPVVAGQVVAYVGDTGNSDLPHLHLGWMPAAGGVDLDALTDAYELLQDLCG